MRGMDLPRLARLALPLAAAEYSRRRIAGARLTDAERALALAVVPALVAAAVRVALR
jgi:hypothetical protein